MDREVSAEAIERMRERRTVPDHDARGLRRLRIRLRCAGPGRRPGGRRGCGSAGWVFSLGVVHQWLVATVSQAGAGRILGPIRMSISGRLLSRRSARLVPRRRRLPALGQLGLHQRLRPRAVAVPRRHDPASRRGRAADSRRSSCCRARTSHSTTTGSRWGSPAPAARTPSRTTCSCPRIASCRWPICWRGRRPARAVHDNPLYRQSMLSSLPFTLVAPVLGMAEGALADFIDMAKVRTTRGAVAGGNNRMAEFATDPEPRRRSDRLDRRRAADRSSTRWRRRGSRREAGEQADRDLRLRNRLEPGVQHAAAGAGGRRAVPGVRRAGHLHRQADPARLARRPRRRACMSA